MSEHNDQCALFTWAGLASAAMPELRILTASANGGHRHIAVAAKLKASGVKAGYPDITLNVARHGYHGLFIELKFGKGRVSESQKWWHEQLMRQRYLVSVCYGWQAAKQVIVAYLGDGIIIEQNREGVH